MIFPRKGWRRYQQELGAPPPVQLRIIKRADVARWEQWARRRQFARRVTITCGVVLAIVAFWLLAGMGLP